MPAQAFDLPCMHCGKKLHCPAADVGHRIRCPYCGSAMMADIGRKSEPEIDLSGPLPEQQDESRDDTDI